MELIILRPGEYALLYNCTGLDIDQNPIEQRQHLVIGIAFILVAIIYFIFYIPCMISIWGRMRTNACYALMFMIGAFDLVSLNLTGVATGIVCSTGAIFCSAPTLLYVIGCVAQTCWCGETSTAVVLALNRVVDIVAPKMSDRLFARGRIWFWMAAIALYCSVWLLYYHPTIPSAVNVAWSLNPFIKYRTGIDGLYVNPTRMIHNYLLVILFPIIYGFFCFKMCFFTNQFGSQNLSAETKRAQKLIFIQVFIISALNMSVASLYHSYSFIPVTKPLIVFTQFLLLTLQGCCPIIYLALNGTIRNDCKQMMLRILPNVLIKAIGLSSSTTTTQQGWTHHSLRITNEIRTTAISQQRQGNRF